MKEKYKNGEFCESIGCPVMGTSVENCKSCMAYRFHDYLITHGYGDLERVIEDENQEYGGANERGNSFGIPWEEGGFD